MLYNKEVKQIKDQIVKQIIGNYLKGAGENAAYLKEVKASNLGAVFLNYGEAIDLTSETLVDYNKSNPKMQSAGTLSLLIKETFDKIDRYAMKCETMEYPTAVVKKDLTKYANSLLDGVNIVAFSEGAADTDLKSDIKILLREGREEFNKRMSEEENEIKEAQDKATQDPTATEDAPTEEEATDDVEDDSDFIEEDTDAEEETDETDEEEPEDEEVDYEKLANDEYGNDDDEAEEGNEDKGDDNEEEPENEEDEIPTGESYRNYKTFSEGAMSDMVKKAKDKFLKLIKKETAEEKAARTQREREEALQGYIDIMDNYINSMDKYLMSDNPEMGKQAFARVTDFLYEIRTDPHFYVSEYEIKDDVVNAVYEREARVEARYIKHVKDKFGIQLRSQYGSGESHMFKRKSGYTTIDPQAFEEMVKILLETETDTLKAFSESKGIEYIANSTDYAITSKTLINTTAVVLAARYKFGFYN